MGTWTGWQNQFLNAAGIIETPPNRDLLTSWAKNAHSSCGNNPIDLSHKLTGATKCANNTGINPTTWKYTSHTQAANAFKAEIHASWAAALLKAMNTGNPYQVSYYNDVGSVFVSWGSDKMLNVYLAAATGSQPSNPPPITGGNTGVHKGWHSVQQSLNHKWPSALNRAERELRVALRSVSKARKVRL